MSDHLAANVLRNHLDADFHRRGASVIDRSEKGHKLPHLNRLTKHHLVHAHGHHIGFGVAACTSIGHLVQQFENGAAVDLA